MNTNPPHTTAAPSALLRLRAVSQHFGALCVLNQIHLDIYPGDTLGLIGPNGAGKTSVLNVASGFSRTHTGSVEFQGRDIRHLTPAQRARRGLLRGFQSSQIFPQHSIRHNLALALRARAPGAYAGLLGSKPLRASLEHAEAILAQSLFRGRGDILAHALSYGEARLLDLLLCLAPAPALLLLDEPTAGLSNAEAHAAMTLLQALRGASTVVLVSHDLDLVYAHCPRIAVLNLGELLVVDTRERVRAHAGARAAYLGGVLP